MCSLPPYRFLVTPFEEGEDRGFLVELPDCPGCFARGETLQEALDNIDSRYEDWCEASKSLRAKQRLSGAVGERNAKEHRNQMVQTFSIQVPRTLYVKLSQKAQATGRTLIGYVTMALHDLLRDSK